MGTNVDVIDLTSPKPQVIEIHDSEPDTDQQAGTNTMRPESAQTDMRIEGEADGNGDKEAGNGGVDASSNSRKKRARKKKRTSVVSSVDQLGSAGRTPEGSETPKEGGYQKESDRDQEREVRSGKEQSRSGGGGRKRRRDASEEDNDERVQDGGRHRPTSRRTEGGREFPHADEREKEKEREYAAPPDDQLFFFDLAPVATPAVPLVADKRPGDANDKPVPAEEEKEANVKLLVPAHVTVLGSTPVDIIQPAEDGELDEDFINYLDYDDSKHMTRYYDEPKDETAELARTVCKNCGAEGDHKTSQCTIMICLTCGRRNEHSTRSCPISKVCFTCGMKGHINANCPNRRAAHAYQTSREVECDRCSSSNHKSNECPSVWRLYEYYSAEEQARIISLRQSKRHMKLGEGGEGYIADDEWCYHCGQSGHWGDDCYDLDQPPEEHSAFSQYNVSLGPFFDPNNERRASTSRSAVRDWTTVDDRWGKDAPGDVGKKGRMKSRANLERQAAKQEEEDDWFGRIAGAARASNRNGSGNGNGNGKEAPKSFTFGKGLGSGKQFAPPPPPKDSGPSLLARLEKGKDRRREKYWNRDRDRHGDSGRYRDGHQEYRDDGDRSSRHSHKSDSSRRSDPSRRTEGRDSGRHREPRGREERGHNHHNSDNTSKKNGPRYRGGYIAR